MDPSEKSTRISRADLIGLDIPLPESQKPVTDLDTDPEKFVCVNPYDVNPLVDRIDSSTPLVTIDIPLKGECSAVQEEFSARRSSGFYGTQRKIKLEMEEFGDLSSFLPRPTLTNSVDELNTPIFEKDAFDFDISNFQKNCQTDIFVKLEYDANYRHKTVTTQENNNNTNIFNEPERVHRKESIPSEIGSNNNIHHLQQISGAASAAGVYSPPASENGTYIYRTIESPGTISYDVNDSALSGVISRHCSYPSSPSDSVFTRFHAGMETPEDSFSSYDSAGRKLSLDLSLRAPVTDVVSTPNIIADVVDLESDGFNILDLVKDDIPPHITAEDIFVGTTVTLPEDFPLNIVSYNLPSAEKGKQYGIATKQPRKRQRSDDLDEDYFPPSAKRKIQHRQRRESSDSDSDFEVDAKPKQKRRGRPPKRTESVSSDRSKDSDNSSKYRELRDKNNEASRKSRLKRKIKELEIETEADELTTRNIQLKAQVEELEKIVKSYKDNIFKIMLSK
ncbi:uncharacterized protein isoform X2 [Leptinotarsa decemlineata]|nr:uncharacterized protein LOC111504374 isoform X2 [Leptinotarsa decemlineata]XP_023014859.1 uncharacterized protein LOC111504374 isoform X2 [Leptinotarsa decemlineata]XP_023014937.1 uncharacterized protein LOC111504374 isoform X2 [Leptinotarsa decemlineata]